jgi:cytochrome c
MKKIITIAIVFSTIVFSCSQSDTNKNTETEKATPENSLANNPDYHKGTVLYLKNDCSTCHAANTRVAGPSYAEVAAKYKGDTAMIPVLADRIIKGGKGVWGEVEMPAHPNLSKEDAIALVKYVYLLKE